MEWCDVGSGFHAAGPVNAEFRSPNLRRVTGCSYRRLLAERSRGWDAMLEIDVISSDIYDGLHPVWMRCMRVHSLTVTRCSTESQCSLYKAGVTWSCDRDHRSVSRQHSECAAMERWLTLVAQSTQSYNSPTDLGQKPDCFFNLIQLVFF